MVKQKSVDKNQDETESPTKSTFFNNYIFKINYDLKSTKKYFNLNFQENEHG